VVGLVEFDYIKELEKNIPPTKRFRPTMKIPCFHDF